MRQSVLGLVRSGLWVSVVLVAVWQATAAPPQTKKTVGPASNKPFIHTNVKKWVKRFERPGRDVYDKRHEIVRACGVKPGMVVADVGAGTGLFTILFAQAVGPTGLVYAVDVSKDFIDFILKRAEQQGLKNVKGIVNNEQSTLLPEKAVDLAFICDTYHHFTHPYWTVYSIRRALKKNGRLVLIDFDIKKDARTGSWLSKHVRAGREVFQREIETVGFRLVAEKKILDKQYFLIFEKSKATPADRFYTQKSLPEIKKELKEGRAVLFDVREPSEWQTGHLAAARLLPLSKLETLVFGANPKQKLTALLPKDKVVYCHCRSGGRARMAAAIFRTLGFNSVWALRAGYKQLVAAGFESVATSKHKK